MTFQIATAVANDMLDAWETSIGTLPVVKFFTGSKPANCAAANTGTELWIKTLAADWASAAAAGVKALTSTPISSTAIATGSIGHYRLYASDGTTCKDQGSVTATGGGGDMTVDAVAITAIGQTVNITAWSKNLTAHI